MYNPQKKNRNILYNDFKRILRFAISGVDPNLSACIVCLCLIVPKCLACGSIQPLILEIYWVKASFFSGNLYNIAK